MDPVTIYAGLTVASAVTSTVANFKKTQSEREAALNQQALKTLEVNEMRRRADYNQQLLSRKLTSQYSEAMTTFGQSVSGGAGTGTDESFEGTLLSNMTKELERAKVEAEFTIQSAQMQADAYGAQAAAINRSYPLSAISGILDSGKDLYSIYKPKG